MSTEKTVVVFRKFKDSGDLIALFPREVEAEGFCSSYQHVGQHGSADYTGLMRFKTVAATPEEYAPLKLELEGLGYDLLVKKRNRLAKEKTLVEQNLSEVNSTLV